MNYYFRHFLKAILSFAGRKFSSCVLHEGKLLVYFAPSLVLYSHCCFRFSYPICIFILIDIPIRISFFLLSAFISYFLFRLFIFSLILSVVAPPILILLFSFLFCHSHYSYSLFHYFKDCFTYMDRGFVFQMITYYSEQFKDSDTQVSTKLNTL